MNSMQQVRIEKLTLNFGSGTNKTKLEKGMKILEVIGGKKPVQTVSKKRIPTWGLRPGMPVGCRATFRKATAEQLTKRLLAAKNFELEERNFDNRGTVSFGVPEYIDIEGVKYDPSIGIIGLEAMITLERPGYRVKKRSYKPAKVGKNQRITKEDAIAFMQKKFDVKIGERV